MQKLKELIKVSNLRNFQLFASLLAEVSHDEAAGNSLQAILKEISAIKNCQIAGSQKS